VPAHTQQSFELHNVIIPMKTIRLALLIAALSFVSTQITFAAPPQNSLAWNVLSQTNVSKPGERYSNFKFWFTNTASEDVQIIRVQSSCFCTVAKLPSTPWRILAGTNSSIDVQMDLAGKSGEVTKMVTVDSTAGRQQLLVKTVITPGQPAATMNDADRLKNMQTALADRQVVFKKAECASCHADPAKGIVDGAQLYTSVCGICHDAEHRASTVPDLKNLPHPTDAAHWRTWIANGRAGSMMPAFAKSEGGPLDDQQIEAIVKHLVRTIPSKAAAAK
jgi:mono/diheme cytochrome c family protein